MKNNKILLLNFLIFLTGCTVSPQNINNNKINSISSFSTIKNEFKVTEFDAGTSPPGIFLNEDGNGIIVWERGYKQIKNFQLNSNEINNDITFNKPSISLNKNGDGIIAWFGKLQYQVTPQISKNNLYTKTVKNYIPLNGQNIISDIEPPLVHIKAPIIKINEEGKGLIVWNKTIDRDDLKAEIYSTEINNFVALKNTNKKLELPANSIPYIINKNNSFEVNTFVLNETKLIPSNVKVKINNSGTGLILWKNMESQTFFSSINKYQLDNSKIMINSDIGDYDISLNEVGNGLIVWNESKSTLTNIFCKKIENYSFSNDVFQVNKGDKKYRIFPILSINSLGTGILSWIDLDAVPDQIAQQTLKARYINKYNLQ